MRTVRYYFFILCLFFLNQIIGHEKKEEKPTKIIGLVAVRNEENIIEQCLRALSYYVDSIVILNDASTDDTLAIAQRLTKELPIEKIISYQNSSWEHRSEIFNKQKLLNVGRELNGTHFICIDADEMFTAFCKINNSLRNCISALKPGQALILQMPHLWRGLDYYREDYSRWSPEKCWCDCIFCDDGVCDYSDNIKSSISGFIHVGRIPNNRKCSERDIKIMNINFSIIHFRFVNWNDIMIKRAWYICLEWIRAHKSLTETQLLKRAKEINFFYTVIEDFNEEHMELKPVNPAWFDYPFFKPECFLAEVIWRKRRVLDWFEEYGKDFFSFLDIWNIDWDK